MAATSRSARDGRTLTHALQESRSSNARTRHDSGPRRRRSGGACWRRPDRGRIACRLLGVPPSWSFAQARQDRKPHVRLVRRVRLELGQLGDLPIPSFLLGTARRVHAKATDDPLLREQEVTGCDLRWLCTEVGREVWFEEPTFDRVAELPATVADIRPPRRAHARFPTRVVRRLPATPQPPAQGAAPSSGDRLRMRVAVPLGACGRAYPGVVIRG